MGEMKIILPDELEKVFRKAAMQRFGYLKGAMSKAAQEAFGSWASTYDDEKYEEKNDPIEAISGLMSNVKKSSVELQHESWDFINEKYLGKKRKYVNRH